MNTNFRIVPGASATITATFENPDGDPVPVIGNPEWFVVPTREQLVDISPDGVMCLVVSNGVLGTATIVACAYTQTPSPIDPEQFRICSTMDVIIEVLGTEAEIKLEKLEI